MSEWVLHCAVNQRHLRRSQPTREAALKDACSQLLQGHAVNRIVGPNETITAERVRDCAQSIDPRPQSNLEMQIFEPAIEQPRQPRLGAIQPSAVIGCVARRPGACDRRGARWRNALRRRPRGAEAAHSAATVTSARPFLQYSPSASLLSLLGPTELSNRCIASEPRLIIQLFSFRRRPVCYRFATVSAATATRHMAALAGSASRCPGVFATTE
jgi:hypothetical protein